MLTRRHIRVKALQSIYAFEQTEHRDMDKQERFLHYSVDQMEDLYLVMLGLIVAVRNHAEDHLKKAQKKHLATAEEMNPSLHFVNNKAIDLIADHSPFIDVVENKKLNYWNVDSEYVILIFNELRTKDWYQEYLSLEAPTFVEDKTFLTQLYKKIIAPNDKLYDYLEDKRLTWVDDFPIVNTALVKILGKISPKNVNDILLPPLYKNEDDREYLVSLFRKTVLNDEKIGKEIDGKTPNWDKDRIADLDMIILKMAIAEFFYFPSIPARATINEYLEISKEYSTPKSSIFINGILDKLVKEYTANGKLKKIGRGLL